MQIYAVVLRDDETTACVFESSKKVNLNGLPFEEGKKEFGLFVRKLLELSKEARKEARNEKD